jgi:hypothetical protein
MRWLDPITSVRAQLHFPRAACGVQDQEPAAVMGCPIRVADVGLTGQFFCGLYRVRRPAPDLVPDLWERLQPHSELLKVVVSQPSHVGRLDPVQRPLPDLAPLFRAKDRHCRRRRISSLPSCFAIWSVQHWTSQQRSCSASTCGGVGTVSGNGIPLVSGKKGAATSPRT